MKKNECKICNSRNEYLFKALVLNKYDVHYYKCNECGFIQTEEPFWLSEAYSSVITQQDIGLLYRNRFIVPILNVYVVDVAGVISSLYILL